MFSTAPASFSLSLRFREAFPISTAPARACSTPALDPTNSADATTSGYSIINASVAILANFSIEVEPDMVNVPLNLVSVLSFAS